MKTKIKEYTLHILPLELYNNVVYNPIRILFQNIQKILYPDTSKLRTIFEISH